MAKVKVDTKTVVTQTVTLELHQHEAEFLHQILRCIGGDCVLSPRAIAKSLIDDLERLGVKYSLHERDLNYSGGAWFKNYKE